MLKISGGEIKGDIMVGEWDKSFHAELHNIDNECYLIAIFDTKNGSNRLRIPQLDIKATIVGVLRGKKRIGDKIEFSRLSDEAFSKPSDFEGELCYIIYHKQPMDGSPIQGQFYVDPQDPLSMFKYTEKTAEIAAQHPHKKQSRTRHRTE